MRERGNGAWRIVVMAAVLIIVAACAGAPTDPVNRTEGDYLARAQTQSKRGVTVRAAVPSAKESLELFGMNLYRRGIQPVWLEIDNQSAALITFLPVGLDPSYFTPVEAANWRIEPDSQARRDQVREQRLFRAGINLRIGPGETRGGFIFSALDEGTKSFNVDIVGDDWFQSYTFFIPVPGLRVDHYEVDWDAIYPAQEVRELDADELVRWLESQACCTRDKKGKNEGDPLNLVVVGDLTDTYAAFIRAGWDETETITAGTTWKTVKSFLSGGEYRYSPVSALYVFGRPQDVAFQKARENIHERNHLRLWLAPVRYEGQRVWLGQISRDIGVRFTRKTITTHKIDPAVDETREFLLEDLAYAQSLDRFAYVRGVGVTPLEAPRGNLTGDPWFSDGYRLVLWVTAQPRDLHEVRMEPWRNPLQDRVP